jgi:hypothetical protein
MAFEPESPCRCCRVDPLALPPCGLTTGSVQLAVMSPTKRHGELVADLLSYGPVLCKAKMVRIRWLSPADETGLLSDQPEMFPITYPPWFRQC